MVLAYGSDRTLTALRAVCPPETVLLGYGHRVSFGLVLNGADWDMAARGLATDVLLYDQGGCLSPQTVFVEGKVGAAREFAMRLAEVLADTVPTYPLPYRDSRAAMLVREARVMAHMEAQAELWGDAGLRWTVVARPNKEFVPSPTHGVVSVQPLTCLGDLAASLSPVRGWLQGCAITPRDRAQVLPRIEGVTYVCTPGRLQAPPLSWPQDGLLPLRSLRSEMSQNFAQPA
jgi:hypothetical protein